jgi:recombination protein RecT
MATEQNGQIVKKSAESNIIIQRATSPSTLAALKDALPVHVKADRFARIVLTACRANEKLRQSDETSFLACVLQAAQLGLEPNTPLQHCFLIPRMAGKHMSTTLQIGYQGMIDLAQRAARASINVELVYKGEHFVYQAGDSPMLEHTPNVDAPYRPVSEVRCAYAIATYADKSKTRRVVPRWELDKAYSLRATKSDDGIWEKHPEEMMKKTAIRRLFKLLPKSAEMAAASAIADDEETGSRRLRVTNDVAALMEREGLILNTSAQDYDPDTGEVSAADEPQA